MARGEGSGPRPALLGGGHAVAEIVAGCPMFALPAGEPYFRRSFPGATLLAVEVGFVVVRSTPPGLARSVVTCEAGPGRVLLLPDRDEVLGALTAARLVGITTEARD